jgi:capsular exopolysaccharide synthesis family protein
MNEQPGPDRHGDQTQDEAAKRRSSNRLAVRSDEHAGVTLTPARGRALPPVPGAVPLPAAPESDLWNYLTVLRRRWAIVVGAFAIVVAGAGIGTLLTTPVYRSSGTIEIRKQAAEVVPVDALFQVERISDQYLQTQYALLRSPALSRRAVTDASFVAELNARGLISDSSADAAADDVEALARDVARGLGVDPVTGSRIVRVRYDSYDPWLAAAVVSAVFKHFIASREEAAAAALHALAGQADSVRRHVEIAEEKLQQFVRSSGLGEVVGASGMVENGPQERLRNLMRELTAAETETYRAAAASGPGASDPTTLDSELLRQLRTRISDAQREYARVTTTFTDSFPRARQLKNELTQLETLLEQEQRRVSDTMGSQYQIARRRRALLEAAVAEQRAALDNLASKAAEYDRLKREVDAHNQLYATLRQKHKEATVSVALSTMDIAVLDAPTPALRPIKPSPRRDLPLAVIVGLVIGIGLAFLRDYMDTSVRTAEEVATLGNVPVLALIPSAPRRAPRRALNGRSQGASLVSVDRAARAHSALTEAFSGLRTSVLFNSTDEVPRSLLITSAQPGEGKTTISTNLAISLTALGRRVLLVDADTRRPTVHRVFRIHRDNGLSDFLTSAIDWRDTVQYNVLPLLDVIPAGSSGHSAADLLSGIEMSSLITEAEAEYDFVIIDAPALFINAADARILAPSVTGVLLVVRSGSTPRDLLRQMIGQIPNLMGVVLNDLNPNQFPAYYREYGEPATNANGRAAGRDARHFQSATAVMENGTGKRAGGTASAGRTGL